MATKRNSSERTAMLAERRQRQRARHPGFEPSTKGNLQFPTPKRIHGIPGHVLRKIRAQERNFFGDIRR